MKLGLSCTSWGAGFACALHRNLTEATVLFGIMAVLAIWWAVEKLWD